MPGYTTLVNKGRAGAPGFLLRRTASTCPAAGGLTDQVKVDDKLYELPFRSDFWVMFYNKDVFDGQAWLTPPNDMTFEQYDALAGQLTNTEPGQRCSEHIATPEARCSSWDSGRQNNILDGKYEFLKPYYEMI